MHLDISKCMESNETCKSSTVSSAGSPPAPPIQPAWCTSLMMSCSKNDDIKHCLHTRQTFKWETTKRDRQTNNHQLTVQDIMLSVSDWLSSANQSAGQYIMSSVCDPLRNRQTDKLKHRQKKTDKQTNINSKRRTSCQAAASSSTHSAGYYVECQ